MENKKERERKVDKLVEMYIRSGRLYDAVYALRLGASESKTQELMDLCIREGRVEEVKEIARIRNKRLSNEEKERLLKSAIENGLVYKARKAAKMIGRKLTLSEIDNLTQICIKKGRLHDAIEAVQQGAFIRTFGNLIETLLDRGFIDEAVELAFKGGSGFVHSEVIKRCIEKERLDLIEKFIEKQRVRESDILRLMEFFMKRRNFRESLSLARKLSTIGDYLSKKAIDDLLELSLESGDLETAIETAKLLERNLTLEEIDTLISSL